MTALLFPAEAAQLRPGEDLVIVRAGDHAQAIEYDEPIDHWFTPQDWVAFTGPCPTCDGSMIVGDPEQCHECGAVPCSRHRCDDCETGLVTARRDGRRIVPLYTACPTCRGMGKIERPWGDVYPCPTCERVGTKRQGRVVVGRGSIEVVPVYADLDDEPNHSHIYLSGGTAYLYLARSKDRPPDWYEERLTLDPLPVPGRDFGIVIDCVEVSGG